MLAAGHLHGDLKTIGILAKGKCTTGRIWTMCGMTGPAPPTAAYYASSDRRGEHPQKHLAAFAGILQADFCNGSKPLFDPQTKVLPITPALCFAHARRGFFELADIEKNAGKVRSAYWSLRSRLRRSDASMPCSRSSRHQRSRRRRAARRALGCARKRASRLWRTCTPGSRVSAKPSSAPPRSST
ncbi:MULTISPECIES: IS66 family transposase [Bradyrhizobium]|uniref:IS66 family transposase n=1 Tax=Bradyrhizobium centrosematis TaxID=1300039 RepID=UPI0035B5D4F0